MNQGSSFVKWFATLPHVVASLYHEGFVVYRVFVERLVERLDDACFICFCPLMSTFVDGFLSALLSILLSGWVSNPGYGRWCSPQFARVLPTLKSSRFVRYAS